MVWPERARSRECLLENAASLSELSCSIQGTPLKQLRNWSRRSVCESAHRYIERLLGESMSPPSGDVLVVSGHQPTLYHPGVWLKNFAAGAMADESAGVALNLIVDNDVCATTNVRIPQGTREAPNVSQVAFDSDQPSVPWEEMTVGDPSLFKSFGTRVAEAMSLWDIEPLASEFWPVAAETLSRFSNTAECLTAARLRQERRWGLANLELPVSWLCRLEPFLWFMCHVLAHLPRFCEVHNAALAEYRQRNKLRSNTHPVPELKERDGWFEAPFWVWRAGQRERRRLFAQLGNGRVSLSDGLEDFACLPLSPDADAKQAVEELQRLSDDGIRLRTRALTTTLFARLCLADLFVHGIGGAKYDELTDRIIESFFEIKPPVFATVSGTLYLPGLEAFDVTTENERCLQASLRDVHFNPQRHLSVAPADAETDTLVAEKTRLIAAQQASRPTGLSRRERRSFFRDNYTRYRAFQNVNAQLRQHTDGTRRSVEADLERVRRQLQANEVLRDRDYPFILYPAENLQTFVASV